MKQSALILFFLVFTGYVATAQNQANRWYFGSYCSLDFNSGVPVNTGEIIISSSSAVSIMSDTNGSLLCATNAERIVNREGHIMPNGGNLIGDHDAYMGTLIVQQPGSDHLYYVFTVSREFPDNIGMFYSVVDMNLDGGLGDVTAEKNVPLQQAWAASNKLTSVRHANGEDVWIITRNFKTDQWYVAFLLTSTGLSTEGIITPIPWRTDMNNEGSMKVSPNKKYLAAAYRRHGLQNEALKQSLDICSFNATSGEIGLLYTLTKNPNDWTRQYWPQAVEFSPDSKLLYVTYYNSDDDKLMELYQYDMQYVEDSLQFKESEIFIARGPVEGLQLARDGKIYTTIPRHGINPEYLSVIHEPWKRGIDCNFQADAVYLGNDRKVYHHLPNMLLDHLYRFEWEGECARHPIAFQPNFLPDMVSILWNFGDMQSSTELRPVHFYENGGEYEVHVTVTYQNGRVEETSRVITIKDSPRPDLGLDQLICEGEETVLTAGSDTGFYAWSTGSIGNNVFSITVSDSGTYWVKVTNDLGCSISDTIHVGFYPKALFNEDNLLITPTACGGSSGSIEDLIVEGAEPLIFNWYDGNDNLIATTLHISNLAVGNYFLHVLDSNGCKTISAAYTITDAGDIEISEVEFSVSYCEQNNGSIEISATSAGGTDLLFSIDNGTNWQSDSVFTNLPAGNYFVKVGDVGDCETVFENNPVVIENIEGPEINSVNTTPETDYSADGQIDISATVSEGDVFYSIDNGSSFQTNNGLFTGLSAGTYYCIVKDESGCDTIFTIVLDRIFSQVIDAIAGDGYTCIGNATASPLLLNNFTDVYSFKVLLTYDKDVIQCDGYIQIHPQLESGFQASIIPALGEVHINWQGETPITLPENAKMAELVFSGLDEGVSQVDWKAEPGEGQFFNQSGEEIAVNYELGAIRIYTRPNILMMGSEQSVCEGDTVVVSPLVLEGSGELNYFWEGPDNFSSNKRQLIILGINANQNGNYKFTVTDTVNCVESKTIDITVNPFPEIAFANYDTIWAEPGYLLEAGNGAEYYFWNTGEITEAIQIDSMGHYVVEVISYEGCKSSDAVQVLWGGGTPFYLPNAFTPNGDGLNDIFKAIPKYDYVSKYQLTIFNRWGQQIFECNDIDCGWDGNYNGKASPNGAYIYKIVYEEISRPGQSKTLEGTVVLVR
ncbi:MAG: gliding motility-associated C-terminal domain-containing protein [Bacteroidales bacterium]|nr:gliding motility-associated C-terminal domain-containing protein [Bacteroidales bacterium]